jgi:hypothetical protein
MNKMVSLERRCSPIFRKALKEFSPEFFGSGETYLGLKPPSPSNYEGLVDSFIGAPRNRRTKYILLLDQKHLKFEYWNNFLKVEGENFRFDLTFTKFLVIGGIVDSGEMNDFKYYFVRVSESKK